MQKEFNHYLTETANRTNADATITTDLNAK